MPLYHYEIKQLLAFLFLLWGALGALRFGIYCSASPPGPDPTRQSTSRRPHKPSWHSHAPSDRQ